MENGGEMQREKFCRDCGMETFEKAFCGRCGSATGQQGDAAGDITPQQFKLFVDSMDDATLSRTLTEMASTNSNSFKRVIADLHNTDQAALRSFYAQSGEVVQRQMADAFDGGAAFFRRGSSKESVQEIDFYNLAFKLAESSSNKNWVATIILADQLLEHKSTLLSDEEDIWVVSTTLQFKGNALFQLKRFEESIPVLDEAIHWMEVEGDDTATAARLRDMAMRNGGVSPGDLLHGFKTRPGGMLKAVGEGAAIGLVKGVLKGGAFLLLIYFMLEFL